MGMPFIRGGASECFFGIRIDRPEGNIREAEQQAENNAQNHEK